MGSPLTRIILAALLICLFLVNSSHESSSLPDLDCYAIGPCTVCTAEESKREASCVETGNREPVECVPLNDLGQSSNVSANPAGNLVKTWRSCSKVKSLEKFYFFKFQSLNIFLTLTAATFMVWRKRQLIAAYQERLARRVAQV